MLKFLEKIVNGYNEREIKKLRPIVDKVLDLEDKIKSLSDGDLKAKTTEFKERVAGGESLDDILPEAFAVVREASDRTLGMKHFPVQVMGGIVLYQGKIAEMKTGEGKTLVATLPAYLNALSGEGVHIVTVNDYLAKRDREWMGKIFEFLGLKVGLIQHDMDDEKRKEAYAADITYGTNNEYGFDYLRDNMVIYKNQAVQRKLSYAIVDEVDSILIDEARTPLIISGMGTESTDKYYKADRFIRTLKPEDYSIDEKANTATLSDSGEHKAEQYFKIDNLADIDNMEIDHHIIQALRAHTLMKKDIDYIVKDGEVVIVDEFTGRLMLGRRYSDGLHQAIEAKEGVKIQNENKTLATITFQNYFRMYDKLAGMTGTAKTEEDEFREIYGLDVVVVPTDRPMIRDDRSDVIYKTVNAKYNAIVDEIEKVHKKGQPVLVGTISIEKSEILSSLLKKKGIPHQVLNAKYHDKEAEIIAQAGRKGTVTIATNMAGRGTDIMLGGNPESIAKQKMREQGFDADVINMASGYAKTDDPDIQNARKVYKAIYEEEKKECDEEHDEVVNLGGLYIIGSERHEARRIDNQLRGRSGRQGDPGASRFYVSLEDDLMRLFGSDKVRGIMDNLGVEEDMPLENNMLTKQIESAQKKVEGNNFDMRKRVLQFDDVMNKQREVIYGERKKVLDEENLRENILSMAEAIVDESIEIYTANSKLPEEWDYDGLFKNLETYFLPKGSIVVEDKEEVTKEGLKEAIMEVAEKQYKKKEEEVGEANMRELERVVLLRVIDSKWMEHIDAMDDLRDGIGLRAYGQADPVAEYQKEGFEMFQDLVRSIQEDTVKLLYHVSLQEEAPKRQQVIKPKNDNTNTPVQQPVKNDGKKIGRNDPCPCGSGKKYKNCCGRNVKKAI